MLAKSNQLAITHLFALAVLLCVLGFATTACDDDTPPAPSAPPLTLTGTWRGTLTVAGTPTQMTWTLVQANNTVTGPVVVALSTGTVLLNGTLSGTLAGTVLTYTIVVGAGGIPSQPACTGQLGGSATAATANTLNGTYSVTASTCSTGLTNGSFTMTKI